MKHLELSLTVTKLDYHSFIGCKFEKVCDEAQLS